MPRPTVVPADAVAGVAVVLTLILNVGLRARLQRLSMPATSALLCVGAALACAALATHNIRVTTRDLERLRAVAVALTAARALAPACLTTVICVMVVGKCVRWMREQARGAVHRARHGHWPECALCGEASVTMTALACIMPVLEVQPADGKLAMVDAASAVRVRGLQCRDSRLMMRRPLHVGLCDACRRSSHQSSDRVWVFLTPQQ